MPYRRLPKTDNARLVSLRKTVAMEQWPIDQLPISARLLTQAKAYLPVFDGLVQQYNMTYESRVDSNKSYKKSIRQVRMYISHFIQVLNMAVMRGEIKKESKEYYQLIPEDYTIPDLSTEESLVEWGRNVIEGEQARIANGGIPLSFPTIAKVKVYYDIFLERYQSQQTHRQSTSRNHLRVYEMREEVDELILQIWDAIEAYYADLLPYAKYVACKKAGVIYYYRTGERHLSPRTDELIIEDQKSTLLIDFEHPDKTVSVADAISATVDGVGTDEVE